MAQTQNYIWAQGEDLSIQLIYKEGSTAETAVVVPLNTGYSLRMDLVTPGGVRVYTFNTADIADVDPFVIGSQADTVKEGTLSSGSGGTPNINITVSRTLTLPAGAVYTALTPNGVGLLNYDVFLRDTVADKQVKILKGTITVEASYTLWL